MSKQQLYNLKRWALKAFLAVPVVTFAQNELYNNGSGITVQSGALIYVQGEVINTNNGANIGLINNSGTIDLTGDWTNNSTSGALNATTGLVELLGPNQNIKGTQPTTFNNMNLLGSGVKTLLVNTYVGGNTGVLSLGSRPMDLNSNTLIVTNPVTGAVTRSTGYVISETAPIPGYGTVQWNIGNSSGSYVYPFGTAAAVYIPLTYNVTASGVQAGAGSISASTYPTTTSPAVNNRPLPTGVADLNNNCQTEHAVRMIDRFWVVTAGNYATAPTATKKMTYQDPEWDLTGGSTNTIQEPMLDGWYYNSGWTHIAGAENTVANEFTFPVSSNYGPFTLGEYKNLQMQLLNVDSVLCNGQNNGVIQFTTNQGYGINTYYWNGAASPDTIRNTLTAGVYTLVAQDIMGCKDTLLSVHVDEPAAFAMSLTANDYSICNGDPLVLTANYSGGTKPYTLISSTGTFTTGVTTNSSIASYHPSAPTTYWLNMTDKYNCPPKADTAKINVNALPNVDFSADKTSGCVRLDVKFTNLTAASPPVASWLWNLGNGTTSTLQSPALTYTYAGSFNISLQATSDSGCVNSITKTGYITAYPVPHAGFYYDPPFDSNILEPEVNFYNNSTNAGASVNWDFGDGHTLGYVDNPSHFYQDTGIFQVNLVVSNIYGCYDSLKLPLKITDISTLYIPNAFTPGQMDGVNDVFMVSGIDFYDFHMMIFNRWGQKIYDTTDPTKGWDGKYGGQPCEKGVYVYKIEATPVHGPTRSLPKSYVGHVTLVR